MRALVIAAAAAAGCQPQPDLVCDHARVVWPYLVIDPSIDTSPDDGIQIDLDLRSSLLAGTETYLFVTGEDGETVAHPEPAVVDEDGDFAFDDVDVPLGRVQLTLSVKNRCGTASTGREVYVWDGEGYPACDLSISAEPADVAFYAPLEVLRAEHDADGATDGLQLDVTVATDRPDMTVSLFVRDVGTGVEQVLEQETGEDEAADFQLTLPEGEQAIRAVCHWEPADLHPSSITRRFFVDTAVPTCELVEPASRVLLVDDEDDAQEGIQFTLVGAASGDDVAGEPATFEVNGTTIEAGALDEAGEATAVGTVVNDALADQVLTFRAHDHAGNACEDSVTY